MMGWTEFQHEFFQKYSLRLPKRYRKSGARSKLLKLLRKYHSALCDRRSGVFEVRATQDGRGLGVFARKDLRAGHYQNRLFGSLRKCSVAKLERMEELAQETSIIQLEGEGPRGGTAWRLLDGPVAIVNHSCERYNAQWLLDERDAQGFFHIELLRDVDAGEEITVHYGDFFWPWAERRFGITCSCETCR